MCEQSPSPSAAEHPESDPPAPLKELIQLYQTEHALLLKHQEEVERRRAAVRAAAVQEASEITPIHTAGDPACAGADPSRAGPAGRSTSSCRL